MTLKTIASSSPLSSYGSISIHDNDNDNDNDIKHNEVHDRNNENANSITFTSSIKKRTRRVCSRTTSRMFIEQVLLPSMLMACIILLFLQAGFKLLNDSHDYSSSNNDNSTSSISEFNYIVVGAGPSGIITAVNLARRLQEEAEEKAQSKHTIPKVLLLESGVLSQTSVLRVLNKMNHDDDDVSDGSLSFMQQHAEDIEYAQENPNWWLNKFDVPFLWNELSQRSDKHYVESNGSNQEMGTSSSSSSLYCLHHWPIGDTFLGRAIGGSGIHNAMINVRALPSDFVRWNISNWTAEEMMPYFNRMESYDNFVNANNSMLYSNTTQIRGENGPLKTVYSGSGILPMDPVAKSFIDASIAAGYPLSSIGFNGPDGEARVGVGYYEFNIRNGLRDSVASALLGNEGNGYTVPSNLVIESNATVLKVLFDDSSYSKPRAVGVKFFSGRTNEIIRARLKNNSHLENSHRQNEVILAAGAIMSPQILSNSKIRGGGRRSNLTHVGKNLQDHPVVAVSFEEDKALQKSVRTYVEATNAVPSYIESIESEKSNQVGVLGSPGFSAGGFLASPWSEDKEPDIQLTVFPRAEEPHYSNQVANDRQSIVKNILVTVALLRPEGRYQINFAQSSESFRLPTIVPKDNVSLLTDLDAKRLAWGIEQVRQIQKNAPLSNDTGKEVYPGSQIRDEELIRFVKRSKMTNSHWCGSTRMGTDTSNSVVDKRLRVHGVEGLRVVDAGVMPFIPNGNTHSTTCAVALRGVDLIFG